VKDDLQFKMNTGEHIDESDFMNSNYFEYQFILSGRNVEIRKFIQYLSSILEYPIIGARYNGEYVHESIREANNQKVIFDMNLEMMNSNQKGIHKYLDIRDCSFSGNDSIYSLQIKTYLPIQTEAYNLLKGYVNYNVRLKQVQADYSILKTKRFQIYNFQQMRFFTASPKSPFILNNPHTYFSSDYGIPGEKDRYGKVKTSNIFGIKDTWVLERVESNETQSIKVHSVKLLKMSYDAEHYKDYGEAYYNKVPILDGTCFDEIANRVRSYVDPMKSQFNIFKFYHGKTLTNTMELAMFKAIDDICGYTRGLAGSGKCFSSLTENVVNRYGYIFLELIINTFNYVKPNISHRGIDIRCMTVDYPAYYIFLTHKDYVSANSQRIFYYIVSQGIYNLTYNFFREYISYYRAGLPLIHNR